MTSRRPSPNFCPRCGKRTLLLAETQPVYSDDGQPTDMLECVWDCVQCDGYRVETVTADEVQS